MNEKEKLIERMMSLKSLIPATIKAIDDLPDIGRLYTILDPGELRIQLDYKPSDYLLARRMLAKKWTYKGHRFNEYTGNVYVEFAHKDKDLDRIKLDLELEFSPEFENGASCRLVEIGHKTETIYGLECK
jgi:hypothetical protein